MSDDLARRWPLPGAEELRDRLLAAWGAATRGYHDLRHLAEVLDHLDLLLAQVPGAAAHRLTLELAAWFHDAVYDADPAAATSDEEASARLAEQTLPAAGLPAGEVEEVARLVRLTERHEAGADDLGGRLLCDADLAILAAPPERYADYAAEVRGEYAHVPDEEFRSGRSAVLRDLLSRRHLFATDAARTRWEGAARRNVEAELARLSRE